MKHPFRFNLHTVFAAIAAISFVFASGCGQPDEERTVAQAFPDQAVDGSFEQQRILFFGDSITAGYGLDPEQAYPALIQEKIDELGLPFEAVNAGVSGETSAGGLRRIDWVLQQPVDVFVLELGGNDGLRGLPASSMKRNLLGIIEQVRTKNPDAAIVVAGMVTPPNLGRKYYEQFVSVFPEVAEETGAELIPFILEGMLDESGLLQLDGIHPTAKGHKVVAETVWETLQPILQERLHAHAS